MSSSDGPKRLVRLQTSDGRSVNYDLSDGDAARALFERLRRDRSSVTAVTLVNGASVSFVRPRGFRDIQMAVEHFDEGKGGERFELQVDDIRLVATSHAETHAFRIFLDRIGRRRFDPRDRIIKK